MFHWNAAIYMDEKVKKKPSRYRRILEKRKFAKSCYCITLPMNQENCLDMYSSRELWFQYYQNQDMEIVGLAASREGAEEILCKIADDVVARYGEINAERIREYFLLHKKKY